MGQLDTLFAPERVAVVGATESDGSVGRAVMENLLDGYEGDVVPVNPSSEEVFGLESYDDLTQTEGVELAIVVVPPGIVNDVLRQAGEAGIRDIAVITAGFGESGSEGVEREREMREIAEEYDINLVGPNCLGVISTSVGMNATFTEKSATPGNISFMSQSGAFISAVLDWAGDHNVGFNDIVSLGNKAVLDEGSFIDYWGDDPDTDVILGYLEDIENGREFIDTAREVTTDTPIVAVKSGRTEAGASAAASHTGAIAGSERAYEAGLEQAGVIRANSVQELFDYATILGDQPLPESNDIAIVTNAGGPGVMATDAIGDSDLEMASFTDETLEALEEAMPSEANIFNPVDVLGDASAETYEDALDIVLEDPNVGSVIVVSSPQSIDFENLADVMIDKHEATGVPMAASLMGGETAEKPAEMLGEAGIPSYFDPARGVDSLDALWEYAEISQHEYAAATEFDVDRERAREILERTKERDTNKLGVEAMELLEAYGIPTPQGAIVSEKNAAVEAAKDIPGDVVMKIVSPDILHKSDIGGVAVGVPPGEAEDTYEDLVTRARNYQPDATILGVQVQERRDVDAGVETIVGLNRDPSFGPLVLFGLGGIFVEVLEDATVRVAPVAEPDARAMLDDIEAAPLLRGARGRDPVDEDSVVEVIQRLSQLATDFPAIVELDVNPLVATADGATAVDLRLTIDPEQV